MRALSIEEADDLANAIGQAVGYLTDNSCSDPDCCGGPYYTEDDYTEALNKMKEYGLSVE